MRNIIVLGVVFAAVGLVLGYLIFARRALGGGLIPIGDLISGTQMPGRSGGGALGQIVDGVRGVVDDVRGLGEIRRNILLAGGGGLVVGAVLGGVLKGK